jgi:hypothetical protein
MVSRAARTRGLVDPVKLLARVEGFAQPAEVKNPIELLRAGMVFHARGLLNRSAIQHNLDWIWPYWVERQYDPKDDSFIPRAFSLTHVNLTHRNWTAVGVPDWDELPIVDPRGLLTPFWDGWSLDVWVVSEDGRRLFPSRLSAVEQLLDCRDGVSVVTRGACEGLEIACRVHVEERDGAPVCRLAATARSDGTAWLVVALRPCNPEGVSFVHDIRPATGASGWIVDHRASVTFDPPAERHRFSDYRTGDVHARLFDQDASPGVRCKVGMASAAALFPVEGGGGREVTVRVPLEGKSRSGKPHPKRPGWEDALRGSAVLRVPDPRYRYLYEAAVRSLVLHSPGEVYPGPYTYKRFWFRDAAFILHAMLCVGLTERVGRVLDGYPARQSRSGFFRSQEGEWDSNGEALWILHRYCELAGRGPKPEWRRAIERGGRWIRRKRLSGAGGEPHAGLLPAGFSAEHLGPNDYYYWDDFWGVAGLRAASEMLEMLGRPAPASEFRREAEGLLSAVERSLAHAARRLERPGMPASPYRRMDSGAIGSLAAGYPLRIFPPGDRRLADTAQFLLDRCMVDGGFFLDIIHSGINPYLTLHLAQVLLRAGDPRWMELVRTVADLASPTGQWPEAVHARTKGGCMGDGHHVWASAEWVLMMRNAFVREEGERLVLASGIPPSWLDGREAISFGPGPTPFGDTLVEILPGDGGIEVRWDGAWRGNPPPVEVRLPGLAPAIPAAGQRAILVQRGALP